MVSNGVRWTLLLLVNERADDLVELRAQGRRNGPDVAEGFRQLETREHLAGRAERDMVLRRPIPPAGVHALGEVQPDARRTTPELSPQVPCDR